MKILSFVRNLPIWAYLVSISSLVVFTRNICISKDYARYINASINFHNLDKLMYMNNSPVLSKEAGFFYLNDILLYFTGNSYYLLVTMLKVFYVFMILLIYAISKKIMNKRIAFASTLLIMSSYSINIAVYGHPFDIVWLSFSLVSILFLLCMFETGNKNHIIPCLAFWVVSFLIKPVAIIFLPLPFIMIFFVKDYNTARNRTNLIYLTSITCICFLAFFFFKCLSMPLEKAFNPIMRFLRIRHWEGLWKEGPMLTFMHGGKASLTDNFVLHPLFIVGSVYGLYQAIVRRKKSFLLILGLILCYIPGVVYTIRNNNRLGQIIFLYSMLYILSVAFLYKVSILLFLVFRKKRLKFIPNVKILFTFFVIFVFIIQFFVPFRKDKGGAWFCLYSWPAYFSTCMLLKTNSFIRDSLGTGFLPKKIDTRINDLLVKADDSLIEGAYDRDAPDVARWITTNIPKGSLLLFPADYDPLGENTFFYTDAKYPIKSLLRLKYLNQHAYFCFIFWKSWRGLIFFSYSQSYLFSYLRKWEVNYIIIGKRFNYFSLFFNRHPAFKKIADFKYGAKIYKVRRSKLNVVIDFKPMIDYGTYSEDFIEKEKAKIFSSTGIREFEKVERDKVY